jgi:DNA-binding MarR family transcriptional regulator
VRSEGPGIRRDQALFPLLVGIERFGPIGVVELIDRVGRDRTGVSRQDGKLESLRLVERRASTADRRVREAIATQEGKAMTTFRRRGRRAREGRPCRIQDVGSARLDELVRLMRKFGETVKDEPNVDP